MKSLYFALAIGVLLCIVTISSTVYMGKISKTMVSMTEDIAFDGIEQIESYWNKNKKVLMALTNHKNCEEITHSISRIKEYISGGEEYYYDAAAELGILKDLCEDIIEHEKLNYYNVF